MDSIQIQRAARHHTALIGWQKDWIHIGTGQKLNTDDIANYLHDYLQTETLILAIDRVHSIRTQNVLSEKVLGLLKEGTTFQLWSDDWQRVVQFSELGVIRLGQKA